MEETPRQIVSVKSMTWKLIGWNLVWGIVGTLIIAIPRGIAKSIIGDNLFIYVVMNLILNAVANYLIWRFSISTAFKNYTVNRVQAEYVMRNLVIVTIILSILVCIINIVNSKDFTKELENSSNLKMANMMSHYLSKEDKAKYDTELQKAIKEAQEQATMYSGIIGISGIIINVGALMLNKKNVYAKTIEEVQEKENIVNEYKLK